MFDAVGIRFHRSASSIVLVLVVVLVIDLCRLRVGCDERGQANEGSGRGGLLTCREDENDDEDENDAAV
jgi:hypothetical protein